MGGDLGWLPITEPKLIDPSTASKYDLIPALVNEALNLHKGEISIVSVQRAHDDAPLKDRHLKQPPVSWHVLQLVDVRSRLSLALSRRKQKPPSDFSKPEAVETLTYAMETMGCQMNVADSQRMEGQLQLLGYQPHNPNPNPNQNNSDDSESSSSYPNLIILNTCSIRDHAEQKLYSQLGPYAQLKRRGQPVTIVVAGCVAQQEGRNISRRFPEVDVVMGPQYTNRLQELLSAAAEGQQVVAVDPSYQTEDPWLTSPSQQQILPPGDSSTALVNVIYGCNERCTYCVVPNTRGVEQSRALEAIVGEVQQLVRAGRKEVTLLGQNIDSWGRDMVPKQRFADLLAAVGAVPGLQRLRFLTSHPKYMSPRVVQAVAANPVIMPNFNVPFQSGDDEVLRQMRRGYSRERYLSIVQLIRREMPDAAITADCIVGFPGETEEQFQNTLSLMEEVKFDQLFAHAYSPRPFTPAAGWDEQQVPEDVKQDRLQRVKRLSTTHALERSQRYVGRIQPVLVEGEHEKDPSLLRGRNPHGRLVYFSRPPDSSDLTGLIVDVEITLARPYSLLGQLNSAAETVGGVSQQ